MVNKFKDKLQKTLSSLCDELVHLIYPKLCLHCSERVRGRQLFCTVCASSFELIDIRERCPHCFQEQGDRAACRLCVERKAWRLKVGAAFENQGAIYTFSKKLQGHEKAYLLKTAASFLLVQFNRLNWPLPDLIVPCPSPLWMRIFKGGDPRIQIAKHLAKSLGVSRWNLISYLRGIKMEGKRVLFMGISLKELDTYRSSIEQLSCKQAFFISLID